MYRNKKDVDKHVESLMIKLSPKDFKTRAYSIARLYFEVGDYGSCQKYVEQYLTQKSNNAAAHKLLGQAFLKLGEKEKALEQYKSSLDIDPTQTSTVLDVCELLADDEVLIDSGRAKYWCEKAEAIFPKHPVTFHLREKLLLISNPDPEALLKLLQTELEIRPKDATLHARLLKHFLNSNKIKEALDHSCNIEFDKKLFPNNYEWYETLSEILKYNPLKTNDWLYQLLVLTVKERICVLSLTEVPSSSSKSLVESVDQLHFYDQAIENVAKCGAPLNFSEFHTSLLQHHRGQLAFHAATYLLKKAKKDQISWRDAKKYSAPLMLIAWQTIPLDSKVKWLAHAPEKQKNAVHRWYLEGTYRCSQSGHYLLSNMQDKSQVLLDQISQLCSGTQWKDKLYEKIFMSPEQITKIKTSHLASSVLSVPSLRLPRQTEVQAYDDDAQREYPNSLHHFVWILLNYKSYVDFKCTLFDMLTSTMTSSGPETLNKVDVLAFLYSATLTAEKQRNYKTDYVTTEIPVCLPANITDLLCTLPQMKWWDCAYKLCQNELGVDYTDIRSTLSRGIEVIRCIDNHGLESELLCSLGRIFSDIAKIINTAEEKINMESRAYLYYSSAIPILEKIKTKTIPKIPEKRLFSYTNRELNTKELNMLLEESKIYIALYHLNDGDYEKAINILTNLKSARAYYHLSETYKKIALEEKILSKNTGNDLKYATLLVKAKQFAYKALDKSKEQDIYNDKSMTSNIQVLIEDIESSLNKIDLNITSNALNDTDFSEENVFLSEIEIMKSKSNYHRNVSSTPKQSGKPYLNVNAATYRNSLDSHIPETGHLDQVYLERIEKQIKNLQRREAAIDDFMEQTKGWFEENRKLGNLIITTINSNNENTTEQFRLLKVSVDQIKKQVDECTSECKDVAELKKHIAELKKEVNKLKKTSEQNVDESDLYNLENEFRANENTSTFGAQLPFTTPQVVPPFTQRLIPPFSVPSNPYQLYGQNFYNLYNQFSQFAQAPTVPAAPQMFDPTRNQINYTSVYPTPDQMYLDVAHLVPPTVPSAPTIPSVPTMPAVPTVLNIPTASTLTATPIAPSTVVSTAKGIGKSLLEGKEISLPINVVITSSDPLPTCTTTQAPVLSVTIPQKFIKPHNYQIPMPSANDIKVTTAAPVFTLSSSTKSSDTTSATLNWNSKTMFLSSQAENTLSTFSFTNTITPLENSRSVIDGVSLVASPNTNLNKSRTLSERSNTSENYDPCPDFKPLIPLPAEVTITTGEEDEIAIFSSRAKLFRFVDKQWKERGIGEMKLLKHKLTGKVRVLMRREQVHKICANHIIVPEMEIIPMKNETKAYCWVANDFAEETVILEKFCIRFKTVDIAKAFYNTFEKARKETSNIKIVNSTNSNNVLKSGTEVNLTRVDASKENQTSILSGKTIIGGLTFSSNPTFKSITENTNNTKTVETPTSKINVFSGLTFKLTNSSPFVNISKVNNQTIKSEDEVNTNCLKLNSSDMVPDFEPTTEFKPVVPLPALIDPKTGEEDEIVLFEHRAKLLRFDIAGKEWKERGLGNIKLLVHKDNNQKLRLLMRREQIMKVCCNHSVTKEMTFQKMPNVDKAVTWCAKDFSDGELVAETFCLRFKTAQACDNFVSAIKAAQSNIRDEPEPRKTEQNISEQNSQTGFGDKFKPKPGSWCCETCYTNNLQTFVKCACCETPNPQKSTSNDNVLINQPDWGEKFKPKPGSWECKQCFIRNEAEHEYCIACNNPKDPTKTTDKLSSSSDNVPKFNFGIPKSTTQNQNTNSTCESWGDKFKEKEETWECKNCFIRNKSSVNQCGACNNPKNLTSKSLETKYSFGISQETGLRKTESLFFTSNNTPKFTFGIPKSETINFGTTTKTNLFSSSEVKSDRQVPIDFSLKNNIEEGITLTPIKPALLQTPKMNVTSFGEGSGTFEFSFKPKTSMKGKSPVKSPKENKGIDSDENEYASEDEGHHIHFSPVIPMPDKIEVVTGEENEEELYSHRAKLFRLTNKEWKERGIGIVKILKQKETGKLRILMRREQVHKICLNHALVPDILYQPKDEKTWLFVANDFSEGEVFLQHFCLRFKHKEIAMHFKEAVDNALKAKYGSTENNCPHDEGDTSSEDVIFVNEIQASNEDKQKARELMLPENFYVYKSKQPCQGCRGCNDKDVTPELTKQDLDVSTPLKTSTSIFQSPSNSIYGTPTNHERTVDTTIFRTPLSAIGSNVKQESTPTTSNNSSVANDLKDKENTLTESSSSHFPIKPVLFVSSGQQQNQSSIKNSILTPSKLSTLNTTDGNKTPKSIFGSVEPKPIISESGNVIGENNSTPGNIGVSINKSIFSSDSLMDKVDLQSTDIKSIFSDNTFSQDNLFSNSTLGGLFGPAILTKNQSTPGIFNTGTFAFGKSTEQSKDKTIEEHNIIEKKTDSESAGKVSRENIMQKYNQNTEKSVPETVPIEPFKISSQTPKLKTKPCELKTDIKSGPDTEPEAKETILKVDNSLTFEALSSSGPAFVVQKNSDFKWEGAGQQLFVNVTKAADDSINSDLISIPVGAAANDSGAAAAAEDYDPHYEPIVPLPDKITVTTGEEDEEKLFGERCKLFRIDEKTREWKERGIGEMKILYHPHLKSYRLLLRREQVHKAVLNMLLFTDLELLPLKNSDWAWTWAGCNFAEGSGEQEILAVRFKTVQLAKNFHDRVMECVRKLQSAAAKAIRKEKETQEKKFEAIAPLRLPKQLETSLHAEDVTASDIQTTSRTLKENVQNLQEKATPQNGAAQSSSEDNNLKQTNFEVSEEHGEYDEEDYENEDYEDYYEKDEEEEVAMYYPCRAVMRLAGSDTTYEQTHVQVCFDNETCSPKILVTDYTTGEIISDMLIYSDTKFQMSGDTCSWSGVDFTSNALVEKGVTITFPDNETSMDFYNSCENSKSATYALTDPES